MIWPGQHAGFWTPESSQENKPVSARDPGDAESFSRSPADSLGHASMLVYLALGYMCLPARVKVY